MSSNNIYFCGSTISTNNIILGYCLTPDGSVYSLGGVSLNPVTGAVGSANLSVGVTNNANNLISGTSVAVSLPDTAVTLVGNPGSAAVEFSLGSSDATGTLAVTQGVYLGNISTLASQGYARIQQETTTLGQEITNTEEDISNTINSGIAVFNTAVQVVSTVQSAVSTVESFLNGGPTDGNAPIFTSTSTDVEDPTFGSNVTAVVAGSNESLTGGSSDALTVTGINRWSRYHFEYDTQYHGQ